MGFFSKIKANMNHGGVKVQLLAPGSIDSDQIIPVQITLSAESAQTINSVKAEIQAEQREQGASFGGGQGVGVQQTATTIQTVAVVENREPFTLAAGESKIIDLQLYLSGGVAAPNPLANLSGNLGILGQVMQSVVSTLDHVNYLYSIHASADVDGITLDPSASQSIQFLPPSNSVQQDIAPGKT